MTINSVDLPRITDSGLQSRLRDEVKSTKAMREFMSRNESALDMLHRQMEQYVRMEKSVEDGENK